MARMVVVVPERSWTIQDKLKMKNFSLRSLSAVTFGTLLCVSSVAQVQDPRRDPARIEQARQHAREVGVAFGLVRKAREAMNLRHFDKVRILCDRAIEDLFELGGAEYTTEAHEVLAEAALLQGRPAQALRETEAVDKRFMTKRFGMTRALALLGVGRRDEARAMVLAEVGTVKEPGNFRNTNQTLEVPLDYDASDAGLAASIYVIRARWLQGFSDRQEPMDDLLAAAKLKPQDGFIRLLIGEQCGNRQLERARDEYRKAQEIGNERVRLEASKRIFYVTKAIAERDKAKTGG